MRKNGMRVLVCLILAGCSAGDANVAPAANGDESAAIAMAKGCIVKNGYTTVWKTPIVTAKITAMHGEGRKWA